MDGPSYKDSMKRIQEFADFLNSLEGLQREIALDELHERLVFCTSCYMTRSEPQRCQCENDE